MAKEVKAKPREIKVTVLINGKPYGITARQSFIASQTKSVKQHVQTALNSLVQLMEKEGAFD